MIYHRLTEIDRSLRTAKCSVCGPVHGILSHGPEKQPSCRFTVGNQRMLERGRAYFMASPKNKNYHNLTVEERDAYIRDKVCEVCGTASRLVPDHDHDTNQLRGVLCHECNKALGMLGDGRDIPRIEALLEYAKRVCS